MGDDTICSVTDAALGDYIEGGSGDDVILAGAGRDRICGGDGDDEVRGRDGENTIYRDLDDLYGDGGNDTMYGGASGYAGAHPGVEYADVLLVKPVHTRPMGPWSQHKGPRAALPRR